MAKCPYTRKKCMQAECELWDTYPLEEKSEATGRKIIKDHSMCTLKWQTKIAFDTAGFHDYTGKAVDRMRNDNNERQDKLLSMASQRPRLIKHAG